MQENNDDTPRIPVLVRSWGDEPVKLFLYAIDNNRCLVGSQNGTRSFGLPVDQVFSFDLDRFANLSTAFKQGDMDKLGELWAKIPVDDCSCNRYQDMLASKHDQEHFADTERVTSGHDQ